MSVYLYPIKIATLAFPVVALLITIPFLVYEYHKYGSLNKLKAFLFYLFVFYMISAYFLVILPLPAKADVNTSIRDMVQLIPFQFVADFLRETVLRINDPSTYVPALLQGVFIQVIFNIFMTIPFGVFMRYYYKKSLKQTIILTLCLSLFYEITQLSGLFGYYSSPYRLFDVDDLILNTTGGIIGFHLEPYLTAFFPSREVIDQRAYAKAQNVTMPRRLLSYFLDSIIILFISNIISGVLNINDTLVHFTIFMIYTVLWASRQNNQTLAQKILNLRISSDSINDLAKRSFLFYIFINQGYSIINAVTQTIPDTKSGLQIGALVFLFMFASYTLFIISHFIYVIISKQRWFFYETLSNTYIESTLKHDIIDRRGTL